MSAILFAFQRPLNFRFRKVGVKSFFVSEPQRAQRGNPMFLRLSSCLTKVFFLCAIILLPVLARGEAMLQLFNVNWDELIQKMPEIAEAGYTSLWLPPPAKAGSVFSVGYDQFDPFDLGDKNQRGTTRTKYGTKEQLLQVVEIAHRFGIRVYFDNIMNHRGFDVPGFNSSTATNLYPGLTAQDFHLQKQADGTYRNWPSVSDYNNVTEVQRQPLFGLIDLANEPGSLNLNHGSTLNSSIAKISYARQTNREYYMDTNLPYIAAPWRPFNGTSGDIVAEDVGGYLIRAALWTLNETKCDGFRFDAVKHVPSTFFGDTSATVNGYVGAIQTMFDYVHGFGNNATTNGYVEGDDSRNSCFDTETTRNDALLFGEHLGEPPSYQEYLDRGMRLLNSPYHYQFNNIFGNPSATLAGLDQRDYRPYGSAFRGVDSILFAQSHDDNVATRRELHNAYNFMREGLPSIYSDGYNQSGAPDYFPKIANAPYLGEFGDNKMPDVCYLHHQLARGGTRGRWSDADIVAFERYDYRESTSEPDQTVVLFAMNDNYGVVGDTSFDDGVGQTTPGTYYECFPAENSRGVGLVVGFPPGSVLYQLADSPGKERACTKLLVRQATQILSDAQATANDANPVNRKVYVGTQILATGGGAIEFKIPSGGYVCYSYQWPEPSRASLKDAISFKQSGGEVPKITVYRRDGTNGDAGFNPLYPFKMRGSIDPNGNIVTGANVSNRTYSIQVPILTNAPFDIIVRSDASCVNTLVKLDGGLDLNSQLGIAPTTGFDRRDNKPGSATDVFLGYEQTGFQFRYGPEKFAAKNIARNNVTSLGAETYYYTVGGTNSSVNGSGNGANITNSSATWVYHDPAATNTAAGTNATATQRVPFSPGTGQDVEVYVKVGYQFQINRCFVYFTTDGTNPEGSFGSGTGTTKVVEGFFKAADVADGTIDWWKATIPGSNNTAGAEIRYKVAFFKDNVGTISDAEDAKRYGLNQAGITNFNPTTATVWLHNDLNTNNTSIGLREGFHMARAKTFLPRTNKSSVFNTFLQTFYYDSALPTGAIATPLADGTSISNSTYTVVIRTDSTVTGVEYNISDTDANNDDAVTGNSNGNGITNGQPKFVSATSATPNATLTTQFPNYPLEWRFNYVAVPSSSSASITVRLKEFSSSVFSNRFTTLTRSLNTFAPTSVLQISDPATEGATLTLETNDVYTILTCFTSTLTTNNYNLFSIYINGVFQPRTNQVGTPLYRIGGSFCPGMRSLRYDWTGSLVGTNTIQVTFTNQIFLSDTRNVNVQRTVSVDPNFDSDGDGMTDQAELIAGTNPQDPGSVLRITNLSDGNRLVVWDSVAGINYQVLSTGNLNDPLLPISNVIQASGSSSFYFDNSISATNKFYRIQVVPQ
jgi:glycosidase